MVGRITSITLYNRPIAGFLCRKLLDCILCNLHSLVQIFPPTNSVRTAKCKSEKLHVICDRYVLFICQTITVCEEQLVEPKCYEFKAWDFYKVPDFPDRQLSELFLQIVVCLSHLEEFLRDDT